MLRLLSWVLYSLNVGKYSKINESNFIGDIDELWIGDNARWYKIIEFWGDTIIWHSKIYSQVTLKSYTRLLLFDVHIKLVSMTNHKMVVTNIGQYIAQVFLTDETIDIAETKKGTGVATPVSLQAQYWFERNAINILSSA